MAELINKPNTKSLSKPINQKMQKSEAQIHKIINDEGKNHDIWRKLKDWQETMLFNYAKVIEDPVKKGIFKKIFNTLN